MKSIKDIKILEDREEYGNKIERLYHRPVKQLTLQVTEDCCLACTYCYQHHKTKNHMTYDLIEPFLNDLLEDKNPLINTKTSIGIVFDFIGGEPLMEIELIDKISSFVLEKMLKDNHPWLPFFRFSFSTNGILYFDKKVQDYIDKFLPFISMSFSIDGSKKLHDACRMDLNGNGTYDRALAACKYHTEKVKAPIQDTKMTLAPENISMVAESVKELVQNDFNQIHLNCVYEDVWRQEDATTLYYQLKEVADYFIDNSLWDKVYFRMFDYEIGVPLSEDNNTNWCGGIADTNIAIDYKGQMFTCIRYMESSLNGHQPALPIGDIQTGYLSSDEYRANNCKMCGITRRSQSTDECWNCPVGAGCSWCSAYNYEVFGTPNKRATFICQMHKAVTLANVYYWNKLAKKLNLEDGYPRYLPDEDALKIIPQEELDLLNSLL